MLLLSIVSILPAIILAEMTTNMTSSTSQGNFKNHLVFNVSEDLVGWEAVVTFSAPVTGLMTQTGKIVNNSNDNTVYTIVSKEYTGVVKTGNELEIDIQGQTSGDSDLMATADLKNMGHDVFTITAVPNNDGTKYNYGEALQKSILFYAAQRSGKLPADNPIPWRGDSALNDRGQNGEDLTGGWYDAGDHVKFGFPQASAVTLLTWSLLQYKDAYRASGQLDAMYDCIRWPLEWLIKCHTGQNELYFQVGDGTKDHNYWGRPEEMTMERPAFKVTATKPGSDIAGEYAAAMAVASIVFKDKDPVFSSKLLKHAKEIYQFGKSYPGIYSKSVKESGSFYTSGEYEDEMAVGAAMLYLATNTTQYLTDAELFHKHGNTWGQSWGNKYTASMVLLYQITKKEEYKNDIETTLGNWLPGATGPDALPYTPKGLVYRTKWGSLRHAANMVFLGLVAAENGLNSDQYRKWAKSQIGYILGDSGRSFVVGFGVNPPSHEHHRASSCPMMPAACSQAFFRLETPNPHTLYGGLVGGPGLKDEYDDVRTDYVRNEVAVDYNAGFQGAIAGLKSLHLRNILN